MGTELNIQQGLINVNTAFQAWGQEAYSTGIAGAYGEYTQVIDGAGETAIEMHFLTNAPRMREWTGARRYKTIRHYSQRLVSKKFEATLPLKRRLVEKDSKGIVASLLPQFLEQMDAYDTHVTSLYDGSSGAGTTGFDGVALFSASHPHSSSGSTQSNIGSGTNLSHANLVAGEYTGMLITQENTLPAKIRYRKMRVGPKLMRRAMELLQTGQRVVPVDANGAEAYASALAAATRSSTYVGANGMDPVVDDRVTNFYWDLIDDTKGPIRPMVLFIERPPTVTLRTDLDDPHVFDHDEFIYGVNGEWVAGAGHWYTCYRGTGTA